MKKILLVGGGGHCKSVIDSVISTGKYDEIGIIDKDGYSSCQGVSVLGRDEDLPSLFEAGWEYAFVTVGSVGSTDLRRKLFRLISDIGFSIPVIIDPTAVVARGSTIQSGTFIGKRAVINTDCTIGSGAIINTGAIIEHECRVGDFAHISPGTVLCGQVKVGNDSHIGAGSVVRQQIEIGQHVLVGAGGVVVRNISDGVKVIGNPCRVIE